MNFFIYEYIDIWPSPSSQFLRQGFSGAYVCGGGQGWDVDGVIHIQETK